MSEDNEKSISNCNSIDQIREACLEGKDLTDAVNESRNHVLI